MPDGHNRPTDLMTKRPPARRPLAFCGAVAGNNAFHFVDEFTGTSGELIIEHFRDGGTLIAGDTDGDGFHELMIQVHEVTTGALSVNDFIL